MEKKVIKCRIFIIPNSAFSVGEGSKENKFTIELQTKEQNKYFDKFDDTQKLVQVWASNDECDNFTDHWRQFEKMSGGHRFPGRLTADKLNIKEGETTRIEMKDYIIEATAGQLTGRYKNLGSFEEVLAKLV